MMPTHRRTSTYKKSVFPHTHRAARRRALQRLYERKAAVEALIRSLEAYARTQA